MKSFVDHLQILPVPSVGGIRQPDGEHRPGGLGMHTLAERLGERGWTVRVEDIGFDKRLPEKRVAESYARAIGDGVLSAWERDRFPIVLTRVNHGVLGILDALGERTGLVWVSARVEYRKPGLLRRPEVDRTTLALVTGRADRDGLAVAPTRLPAGRIVALGGGASERDEVDALRSDGARIVDGPSGLADAVASVDADRWVVHVDLAALDSTAVPAADETFDGGLDPDALVDAARDALEGRSIACVAFARYDLNRDRDGRTAGTLVRLADALATLAGGHPKPGRRAGSAAGA